VIGIFWAYDGTPRLGTPPRLYNQIARQIAKEQGNTLVENARLFALVNLAMADAGIQVGTPSYFYNLWRPFWSS
jgi:Flp pilus assembly pilin Flp